MAGATWRPAIERARRVEVHFARQLRKVAGHVAELIAAFPAADPASLPPMQEALDNYGRALIPWAGAVTRRMHEQVDARDLAAWQQLTKDMSLALRTELRTAPTGYATQRLMREQVDLITSLPRWAGERVHDLTMEAIVDSTRYEELVGMIEETGHVTKSRANLIARTEVARTASTLTQARAQHVGAETYIWRSSGDADVRPSHKKLDATVQKWSSPPVCDISGGKEYRAHAGAIWNCRCFAEPILPE